jgi:hypothetical protein
MSSQVNSTCRIQRRGSRNLVEGEIGLEASEEGRQTTAAVRFKPREGFLAKLARVLSVKVEFSLKDLLPRP